MRIKGSFGNRVSLFFGWVGSFVCVVLIIGLWYLHGRLRQSLDVVTDRATVVTVKIRSTSAGVSTDIQASRNSLGELNTRMEGVGLTSEETRKFALKVKVIQQRLRDWKEFAETAGELRQVVMELMDSVYALDEQPVEEIGATLKEGREQIEETVKLCDDLKIQLNTIRGHADPEQVRQMMTAMEPLLKRVDKGLLSLQGHTDHFTAGIQKIEDVMIALKLRLQRQLLWIAIVATVLMLWLLAGQVALIRLGQRPNN